nr:hypothetical protein [uncultured Roseateles sp.]
MNQPNIKQEEPADALGHIQEESISLDEAMQPLHLCIARLEVSINRAQHAAAACGPTEQKKKGNLLEYAAAQEQQLDWLLNFWACKDFDEEVTVGEAMVGYVLYIARLDLQPAATSEAKERRRDTAAWVLSDDEEGFCLHRVAPAIGLDADTLRANLLREAGISAMERNLGAAVATLKSRPEIVRDAYVRRKSRTEEQIAEVQKAVMRAGLDLVESAKTTAVSALRSFKEAIKVAAAAVAKALADWARKTYPTKRQLLMLGTGLISAMPLVSMASGPDKRDLKQSNEASTQVALPAYVLQAAASMRPANASEQKVQACVVKLTDLAPGGGDVFTQQASVSEEAPLPQLMLEGLQAAAQFDDSANRCSWHLSNQQILTAHPTDVVHVGRDGQAIPILFRDGASKQVGRAMLCGIALAELAPKAMAVLRSQPMTSRQQARDLVRDVIRDGLQPAVARAYETNPDLLRVPVMLAQNNLGSTKPFTVITPGGTYVKPIAASEGDKVIEVVPDQVSAMAERLSGVSTLAIGGFKAWTTAPSQGGYVSKFDGSSYAMTRRGLPFNDASTLGGEAAKVSLSTNGSYASSKASLSGRPDELKQLASCALTMNNLALQLAPTLMRPAAVPRPNSIATQALLHRTEMSMALQQAESLVAGQPIQTDYSENGLRWRLGQYTFTKNGGASRSGVQVTLGGAVLFDDTHAGGRSYTLTSSNSDSTSTGYFFKQ